MRVKNKVFQKLLNWCINLIKTKDPEHFIPVHTDSDFKSKLIRTLEKPHQPEVLLSEARLYLKHFQPEIWNKYKDQYINKSLKNIAEDLKKI